jgi:type II secretory pathway pseudopilin PulG
MDDKPDLFGAIFSIFLIVALVWGSLLAVGLAVGLVVLVVQAAIEYWPFTILLAIAAVVLALALLPRIKRRVEAKKQLAAKKKERDAQEAAKEESRKGWSAELDRRVALHDRRVRLRNRAISVSRFRVRMPRNADDFEDVSAEFLRAAGYPDAMRTPTGPDGGVDVIASGVVGQCKMYSAHLVSAGPVRELFASKTEHGAHTAFFFLYGLGYSNDAIDVGKSLGVRLLFLDVDLMAFREVGDYHYNHVGEELTQEEYLSMTTDLTVWCSKCPKTMSMQDPNCAHPTNPNNELCPMLKGWYFDVKFPSLVWPVDPKAKRG